MPLRKILGLDKLDVKARFEVSSNVVAGGTSRFLSVTDRGTAVKYGLKVIDPDKAAASRERFKGLKYPTESEIAESIEHPGIVEVYETGRTKSGEEYILMELVEGSRLDVVLQRDLPNMAARCLFVVQMAEALNAVHEAGVIHRDVCPRNFICNRQYSQIKLFDFGLAIPNAPDFISRINRVGTPMYMAPELMRRRGADHRVDVFGFGVSAYQLLTGRHPWNATENTAQSALRFDTHDPVDIRTHLPDLSEAVAKAVHGCIQADPEKRLRSLKQFLIALG